MSDGPREGLAAADLEEQLPDGAGADAGGVAAPAPGPVGAPQRPPRAGRGVHIEPNEHVAFIGQSRSGKTHCAKVFLRAIPGRIIVDTKHAVEDFNNPEWGAIVKTPEDMAAAWWNGQTQIVWQPPVSEIMRPDPGGRDGYSRGLRWIYEELGDPAGRASVTVYFDEGRVCVPTQPNPYVLPLVTAGMGRGIGVWTASQNPYHVFGNAFSDAVHVFAFRVQNSRDRAKLEADLGMGCALLKDLESTGIRPGVHEFVYWRQGEPDWLGPTTF